MSTVFEMADLAREEMLAANLADDMKMYTRWESRWKAAIGELFADYMVDNTKAGIDYVCNDVHMSACSTRESVDHFYRESLAVLDCGDEEVSEWNFWEDLGL